MTDDTPDEVRAIPLTRRRVIKLGGVAAAGGVSVVEAFGTGSDDGGTLTGGAMALDEAYSLASAERTIYQGPDSAKDAITGEAGDRYEAVDSDGVVHYYWDPDIDDWNLLSIGSSEQPVPAVTTDQANIADNRSVATPLDTKYNSAAIADDGTYYAVETDRDASYRKFYRGTSPTDLTEVFENTGGNPTYKNGLHLTAAGTLVWSFGSQIRRSTDDGDSWSAVQALNTSSIWFFDENSDGDLIACEANDSAGAFSIWKSTDDGVSWTELANETDFAFSNHMHAAAYHPADKTHILVTGGDGDDFLYRSTDEGATWSQITIDEEPVAVAGHPTDSNIWYLGEDNGGSDHGYIVKLEDTGSGSFDRTRLFDCAISEGNGVGAHGAFDLRVVDDGTDEDYLLAATRANRRNVVAISDSLRGYVWKGVGHFDSSSDAKSKLDHLTSTQGAYRSILDADGLDKRIIANHVAVDVVRARDPLYGQPLSDNFGLTGTRGDVRIQAGDRLLVDNHDDLPHALWKFLQPNEDDMQFIYNASEDEYQWRNVANNNVIAAFSASGSFEYPDSNFVNLRDAWLQSPNRIAYSPTDVRNLNSPSQGHVTYHDGSGTNTEGPAFYNGSNWVSVVDGSTIS